MRVTVKDDVLGALHDEAIERGYIRSRKAQPALPKAGKGEVGFGSCACDVGQNTNGEIRRKRHDVVYNAAVAAGFDRDRKIARQKRMVFVLVMEDLPGRIAEHG